LKGVPVNLTCNAGFVAVFAPFASSKKEAAVAGGFFPDVNGRYLSWVETLVKVVLSLAPSPLTTSSSSNGAASDAMALLLEAVDGDGVTDLE
jgi:hypothetical protein